MSTVSSVSSGSGFPVQEGVEPGSARVPQKTLGKNDFLKLLAVQFTMQDPMKPMDDTAFIAQTAQFSSLEQSTAMATDMAALRADQQRAVANSYLGHRVTVENDEGVNVTGDVLAVDNTGPKPRIVVGDKSYELSAVLRVEPGVVSAPAPANGGA